MDASSDYPNLFKVLEILFAGVKPFNVTIMARGEIAKLVNGIHADLLDSNTITQDELSAKTTIFVIELTKDTDLSQFTTILDGQPAELLIIKSVFDDEGCRTNMDIFISKLSEFGFINQLDIPLRADNFFLAHLNHLPIANQIGKYESISYQLADLSARQNQLLIDLRREDSQIKTILVKQNEEIETLRILTAQLTGENEKLKNDEMGFQAQLSNQLTMINDNLTIINQLNIDLRKNNTRAEYAEEQWLWWKTKWLAFEHSRSWKVLAWLQKIKGIFVFPIKASKKFVYYFHLGSIVLRTQGIRRLITLGFQKFKKSIKINNQLSNNISLQQQNQIICEIDAIKPKGLLTEHSDDVDIIICVHNALEDVKECLSSLIPNTQEPYNLILVDDGSDEFTKEYLIKFQLENENNIFLHRNEKALGYTYAANIGLRKSSAPYIVLLNSDTILSPEWLDRMLACMKHQPGVGIVGPLSNTASWQSVPRIEENGDWAMNKLPDSITIGAMSRIIAENSENLYPFMPLLNGFCLLINRELVNDIGYFDENHFGQGYGEEDDYILRARKANWKTLLADDVYIHHSQSRSYSTERRKLLSEKAGKILRNIHGESLIQSGVDYCLHNRVLEGIRARSIAGIDREICVKTGSKYEGKKILFILPVSSPGGGANVVIFESLAMKLMGVHVDFYNLEINRDQFELAYPELPINVVYGKINDLGKYMSNYDAVIATYNPSVSWIKNGLQDGYSPIIGYYVQGYEPLMYPNGCYDFIKAVKSYSLIENMVRFTKTEWTRRTVYENTNQESAVIGISTNYSLFRPRPQKFSRRNNLPLRIMAMVRPEAEYRQPRETMELLKMAYNKYKEKIEICIFGTDYNNPGFKDLPQDFPFKLYGVLPQQKVAALLNEADIFVDFSSHQAMGLTALEAMACGSAVIVPENGGAIEFAVNERNSLVFTKNSIAEVWTLLQRLIDDDNLRLKIQRAAIYDACKYSPERAALNILETLFGEAN